MTVLAPANEAELAEAVADAAAARSPLEIRGGGTRAALGRPVQAEKTLSTAGLSGISLYEPGALTLVVKAGTPVAEVEAALGAQGQMLPFEPMDHRALLGTEGEPTIGGAVACGVSGPRRIQAGACRDSMLGVRFVNGRGEVIKSGGRVMKNVTGYDLPKLICGSYGTLGVISEISFKVLPKPEAEATLVCDGMDAGGAVEALARAMGSPFGITGAAHDGQAALVRIEGLAGSVTYRTGQLQNLLGAQWRVLEGTESAGRWRAVRDVTALTGEIGGGGAIWRLSVKPSDGPAAVAAIQKNLEAEAVYDWAGGLVWLRVPEAGDAGAGIVRAEIAARGGHATLIRAADPTRAGVEVFQPEPAPLARIARGLRAKFDPEGILNPGKMG
ncbi:MAG: glycolate oxidase subunit GlcE [Paracoccaceae bacterium]|nr:glycolate oxidase subunit GlcE [Paracoccaceae bacterium]